MKYFYCPHGAGWKDVWDSMHCPCDPDGDKNPEPYREANETWQRAKANFDKQTVGYHFREENYETESV